MATPLARSLPIRARPTARPFSTTPRLPVSLQLEKNDAMAAADTVPAYPYGPARWYKQQNKGLYGGSVKQFGNNISGRLDYKSRRSWAVNIVNRRLFSRALNRRVQVRVSSRVLRTIDKVGGLDEYLLGEKEGRVRELGVSGWWLRWAIMQTDAVKKRFAAERRALGLPKEGSEEVMAQTEGVKFVSEPVEEAREEVRDVVAEAEEHGLVTEADEAFVPEATPGLPPLKFRVGPGQHLVLTSKGWRRTRPDPSRAIDQAKERIREKFYAGQEKRLNAQAELAWRGARKDYVHAHQKILWEKRAQHQLEAQWIRLSHASKLPMSELKRMSPEKREAFGLTDEKLGLDPQAPSLPSPKDLFDPLMRTKSIMKELKEVIEEDIEQSYEAGMAAKEEGKKARRMAKRAASMLPAEA